MIVEDVKIKGTWRDIADNARVTIGMENGNKEVKDSWKKKILLAEHSPIRTMTFSWLWKEIPYWVSVHFVRHWLGIIHFVKTSRTDRTGIERTKLPQDNPVNHKCEANVQALINISRKRLCNQASPETKEAWEEVKEAIREQDPIVAECMVPECIYRGFCPEMKSCGFSETRGYRDWLEAYRKV